MAELTEVAEEKLNEITDPIAEEEEENTEIPNDDCESIHSESIHSESDNGDVSDLEDDDDYRDDVEINKQTCALFLQQLWDPQRVNIKKKKQEQFLPLTKKFLNASFVKKETMLSKNPGIIRNLVFLCRNITNGKIPINITGLDKALFTYISDKYTPKADVRLHLLEQFAVHHYCRQALRNIEAVQNIHNNCDGGRCETPGTDRHGEIQHDDEITGSTSKRQKNSRQRKTNSSRRGIN
jgi:hypothetical protein